MIEHLGKNIYYKTFNIDRNAEGNVSGNPHLK